MKKFKLYGKKDNFEGVLATIYVKDGKVVIESSDSLVKETLETEINKAIKENGGGLILHYTVEINDPSYAIDHYQNSKFAKINDEDFIEVVRSNSMPQLIGSDKRGQPRYGFCVKLRKLGYQISVEKSIIVEE